MAVQHNAEKRRFFRIDVDIPATLFLQSSDDMRRSCTVFNLSGSGVAVRLNSLEPIDPEATHQIRFELPNKPDPMYFDCVLVRTSEDVDGMSQELRMNFVNARAGYQDSVISYIQNKKRYERTAFRVQMPMSMEAQSGLRQFVPYKGNTTEVGREYAACELTNFGLTVTSEVVVTFFAPGYRDEVFFQSAVTKVDRNPYGGYKVRLLFENPGDRMLDFVRRHYMAKAKPITLAS